MKDAIALDRRTGDGKYSDVLDVAVILGKGDYGSAANALAVMVRQSELFKATVSQVRVKPGTARKGRKTTQPAENAA